MANPDVTDAAVRRSIINDINSSDNKARKAAVQRRQDVYKKKAAAYVIARLSDEFDPETVRTMRKVTSINPAKRIVDEQASLYVDEPERHWVLASQTESDQLDDLYDTSSVNPQMRLANRYYKLHNQCALYIVPRLGRLNVRALTPKDYDVIPDDDDPESAFAYILNVQDVGLQNLPTMTLAEASESRYAQVSQTNTQIADQNDEKAFAARYVWWTDDFHFTTDGNGNLIAEADEDGFTDISNPIGRLPFVDVAHEKDFRFFVDAGSDVVDFVIDLLVQLSDLSNTSKFQAYSQAIIYSVDEPKNLQVGPNRILWLKVDQNADTGQRPEFKFENPTPDLTGTLEIINVQLKMFLTSQGLTPSAVTGHNEIEKFTSGIDHLLSNLDKFRASKEDFDLFRQVEVMLLEILIAWQNVMFDVNDDQALDPIYLQARIPESVYLDLVYHEPQAVQTESEVLDFVTKSLDRKLMTKLEGIKRIYKVDDPTAEVILERIDGPKIADGQGGSTTGTDDVRKETLNGAQIESILSLVTNVASGLLPKEAGINIVSTAFNLDRPVAESFFAGELKPLDLKSAPTGNFGQPPNGTPPIAPAT